MPEHRISAPLQQNSRVYRTPTGASLSESARTPTMGLEPRQLNEPFYPLVASTLYREFQAEKAEILRHKWLESEKVGHDIGLELALVDWITRHRTEWRRSRQVHRSLGDT